jgi:hypothetical protein
MGIFLLKNIGLLKWLATYIAVHGDVLSLAFTSWVTSNRVSFCTNPGFGMKTFEGMWM